MIIIQKTYRISLKDSTFVNAVWASWKNKVL